MLGRHRPGSEGNLASDLENQDPAVTTAANGDPEGNNSETESAKSGAVKDAVPGKEASPRSKPKSAAEPKPPVEKAASEKPAADGEKNDGENTAGEITTTEASETKPEAP